MPPRITLRPYGSKDFDSLYEIDQSCYSPDIAYSRPELRAYLRFPNADCLIATIRSKAVGFCLTAYRETRGHIITIDVLEAYRRHKIGSRDAKDPRLCRPFLRPLLCCKMGHVEGG